MREELPFVELLQASRHLLAEPSVIVDVVFHELLDVFLGATLVLGSGPFHFRLQLGGKMHFHNFSRLGLYRATVEAKQKNWSRAFD